MKSAHVTWMRLLVDIACVRSERLELSLART